MNNRHTNTETNNVTFLFHNTVNLKYVSVICLNMNDIQF